MYWLILCVGHLLAPPGYAEDSQVAITLSTLPAETAIRPDGEAATVTLQALLGGQPLRGGRLTLYLTAPPRSKLLSTDFPHVEGSSLLALTSDLAPDGTFTFQYVFPIRGVYTLALHLEPTPEGTVFRSTDLATTLQLAENPAEVRHAWLLVLGLFGLGLVVGGAFARSAAARDRVMSSLLSLAWPLLGSLLVSGISVASAQEHAQKPNRSQRGHVVQRADGWSLEVQPQPDSATVGQLLALAIALKHDGRVWPHSMAIELVATNQEEGREVFRTTLHTQPGQPAPRLQFFDGAPHRLTVTARPYEAPGQEIPPLTATLDLEVLALHPPMAVKLRLMALLLVVLISGMAAGFFWPRRLKEPAGV